MSAPALHVFAGATLASGKRLVLDLTRCSHLDSTLLGTLHEIVRSGAGAGGDVVLQGVSAEHRQLFEELSMGRVLAAIRDTSFEPPGALRTPPMGGTRRTTHAHILRAHEALASLSDSNREEFHGVIEDLRRELEAEAPGQRSTE